MMQYKEAIEELAVETKARLDALEEQIRILVGLFDKLGYKVMDIKSGLEADEVYGKGIGR